MLSNIFRVSAPNAPMLLESPFQDNLESIRVEAKVDLHLVKVKSKVESSCQVAQTSDVGALKVSTLSTQASVAVGPPCILLHCAICSRECVLRLRRSAVTDRADVWA